MVATAEIEVGPAAGKAAAELLQSLASQKKFAERTNNLKQIGLALHNYDDAPRQAADEHLQRQGRGHPELARPAVAVSGVRQSLQGDEVGRAVGRADQQAVHRADAEGLRGARPRSAQGQDLLPDLRQPRSAQTPAGEGEPHGRPGVARRGGESGANSIAAIPDGTSNTIAVVEARDAVIWSKPDDLPFGEKLPALGDARDDRFAVLMFDGSVRHAPDQDRLRDATRLHHARRRRGHCGRLRSPARLRPAERTRSHPCEGSLQGTTTPLEEVSLSRAARFGRLASFATAQRRVRVPHRSRT